MFKEQQSWVSLIIENDIPIEKESEFKQWQSQIEEISSKFQGYLGTQELPQVEGIRHKWYTILYFDSPENLTLWLDSDVRHTFLKNTRKNLGSYRFVDYETSFAGWSYQEEKKQSNLPLWKQNLIVLVALYPTVMLESLLISHWQLIDSWTFPEQLLINNLITCSLLTWLVMPTARNLFSFWLKPETESVKINFIGLLLIVFILSLMVSLFNNFY
jgi:antibiotic biosynthesis monooxygenase (ABM) superfamily enzyme